MKPSRSALPLPRYTERKPLKTGGWGYFFHVPSWAKKAGCPVRNAPLGTDYDAAVDRAEKIQGAAEVRQAHNKADRYRHQETARAANKRRTFVRMSSSMLVRMEN